MADAGTGGAPASSGGDSGAAAPSVPSVKVVPRDTSKKVNMWDLEADAPDDIDPEILALANKKEDKAESKPKPKAEKKAKPPVDVPDEDEEDEAIDEPEEDEEDDNEEEEQVKKPRKKSALDRTNDDEDEAEDVEETSEEQSDEEKSEAEDTHKLAAKDLDRKFKVSVKDGDKTIDKDYSLKQLLDMAQKNESGDLKLYQAAEFYKKTENVVERLKTEPFEVLKYIAEKTGKDYYQMIEKEMADQFKLKVMSPEDRQTFLQAEQDKKDLTRFRQEQADIKQKLEQEELTKSQQKIANDFVQSVGSVIESDPYLKHVYDNLDEGDDKNYIIRKFGSFVQNGLMMKQVPYGQPNHLPANFDLSPSNPMIVKLVVDEIKKEAVDQVKQAQKAQKLIKDDEAPEVIVNKAGTKVREKVPGVKSKPSNGPKISNKDKKAKKQSTHDFLRNLVY